MTLPSSGPISFNAINVELGQAGTTTASLGQASYRALAGVASGAISLSNFYGKSSVAYRGYGAYVVSATNSWYVNTQPASYVSVSNTASSGRYTAISVASNLGTTSGSYTRRSGYTVIDSATNTWIIARGYNVSDLITNGGNNIQDQWGNFINPIQGNNNATLPFRTQFYSPSDGYNTPTKTITGTSQQLWTSISTNSNYSFWGGTNCWIYRHDSSLNLTAFNSTQYNGTSYGPPAWTVSGTSPNNENLFFSTPHTLVGFNSVFSRFNSEMTMLSQFSMSNTTGWGANSSASNYSLGASYGPYTNIMSVTCAGRYGGTTSTYTRNAQGFFNGQNSSTTPTFIQGTKGTANSLAGLNTDSAIFLVAVKDGYEYWGGNKVIYKVNSSGLIVQGWQITSNFSVIALVTVAQPFAVVVPQNMSGKILLTGFGATAAGAISSYSGLTTIDALVGGTLYNIPTSDYSARNGQYFYNIPSFSGGSVTMVMGTASYPFAGGGIYNTPITTVSAITTYTTDANAMFSGAGIYNG